jgi:hypothetical protein
MQTSLVRRTVLRALWGTGATLQDNSVSVLESRQQGTLRQTMSFFQGDMASHSKGTMGRTSKARPRGALWCESRMNNIDSYLSMTIVMKSVRLPKPYQKRCRMAVLGGVVNAKSIPRSTPPASFQIPQSRQPRQRPPCPLALPRSTKLSRFLNSHLPHSRSAPQHP